MKKLLAFALVIFTSGCLLERIGRLTPVLPFGAHYVKEGMTRESRLSDWVQCGGGEDLHHGYGMKPGQTVSEYSEAFDAHYGRVRNCIRSKGYTFIYKCDERCLYP